MSAIVASTLVTAKRSPTDASWPFEGEPPADVAALHAACDGLQLDDGTRILGREECGISTNWLRESKSLIWDDDMFVIGERDDLVIVRDADKQGLRAGGGVLEAPTDGLESLRRVSRDILGYLESRVGLVEPNPAPERVARQAIAAKDLANLERVVSEVFYPGNEGDAALAALTLGELHARSGNAAAALRAFEQYADVRMRVARRGAQSMERAAAYRAAARAAESVGALALAEACHERSRAG